MTATEAESAGRSPIGQVQLVVLQPTGFCNINCDYCYLPDRLSTRRMSSDVLKSVFHRTMNTEHAGGNITFLWHLGEPLTVPRQFYEEAFAIAEFTNQQRLPEPINYHHAFQTNATLIDQPWCDFFLEHQVSISISIDGPEDIHDRHRLRRNRTGTHKDVMRGIKFLSENSLAFSALAVLTYDSLGHADRMFDFFVSNGIMSVGFNVEEITGANIHSSVMGQDIEERYRAFMERFYDRTVEYGKGFEVREFTALTARVIGRPEFTTNHLCTPMSILSVDVDGNFSTFCPELVSASTNSFTIGNVLRDSLDDSMKNPRFIGLLHQVQAGVEICRSSCDYFDLCKGGAPSNKWFEAGTFEIGETEYCRYTRKILFDLIMNRLERGLRNSVTANAI